MAVKSMSPEEWLRCLDDNRYITHAPDGRKSPWRLTYTRGSRTVTKYFETKEEALEARKQHILSGKLTPSHHPRAPKIKKKGEYDALTDPLIERFQKERNLRSVSGYTSSLQIYIPLCGWSSAQEMIDEALEDERNRVPIKEARISQHLRDYLVALQDNPNLKSPGSIHTYFTKAETFYRHFNVTLPSRPPMQVKKDYHVDYYDLPSKSMIETAIEQSDILMKAVLYFMSSSGTAKSETLAMTVGAFIDGLRDYTDAREPQQVLEELEGRRDLVPLISMTRIKTNVSYFTCCSSEATYYVFKYLKTRKHLRREDKVFPVKGSYLMKRFQDLNDDNNWGRVGHYRRFRTHTIRKFHASNIGCSFELINTLEGRTNGTIHETYVKQKPDEIKQKYMKYMHNVMIHPEDFIGPECGQQTEEGKLQQAIVDLIPELSGRLDSGVVAKAPETEIVQSQTEVQSVNPQQVMTMPAGTLMNGGTAPVINIQGPVNIINIDKNFIQSLDNENLNKILTELTSSQNTEQSKKKTKM